MTILAIVMALAPGHSLSIYEIVCPIGVGGMGEVYKARDTRLDREVAIKVLPEDLAVDSERVGRFTREAKTLASLNHPNVAAIHGMDRDGNTAFIAMELVAGEDLSERIGRGPLPVCDALDLCRQIAEGLEAAHEAGIVHRDLKPDNIRVTPEGVIKVLDFGLAKVKEPDGAGAGQLLTSLTGEGVLLGTPAYMSPETVTSGVVDRRADIWALGCILYECLTGARPFQADSLAELVSTILHRDPDLSLLPNDLPPGIRSLLARSLDKDPRMRLQDMGEARIALSGVPGQPEQQAKDPQSSWPGRLRILAAAGIAALVTVWLLHSYGAAPEPFNPLAGAVWNQLNLPGSEYDVGISLNGEEIVFGSDASGTIDLWTCSIKGAGLTNLTEGRFPLVDEPVRNVGFKGNLAWFLEGRSPETQTLEAPGAKPETAITKGAVEPVWTRDGSWVVYHTHDPGDPMYVHESGEPKGEFVMRGDRGEHFHYPAWSFDEAWIYYVRGPSVNWQMDLWRMRPNGEDPQQLTTRQLQVSFPTPLDEDTVLFIGHDQDGSGPWLWALDIPTGATKRVTNGLGRYTSVAASGDGKTVVATAASPTAELWSVPIHGPQEPLAQETEATQLEGMPSLRALTPRYANGDLFYLSSRGGGDAPYMLSEGRARELRPEQDEPLVFYPSISPNGKSMAIIRRLGDSMAVSILDVDLRRITKDLDPRVDAHGASSWDPTGEWVVAAGTGPDGPGVFKFLVEDGTSVQLAKGLMTDPVWSPTEDLIVYGSHVAGPWVTLKGVSSDGTPVELLGDELVVRGSGQFRMLPDGSGIVYLTCFRGTHFAQDFWLWDRVTGATRRLTELQLDGRIHSFDISPDGQHIVFDRIDQRSDVVVLTLAPQGG